jgi:hypothetical protein
LFLCAAHFEYYRALFALHSRPRGLDGVPPIGQQAGAEA